MKKPDSHSGLFELRFWVHQNLSLECAPNASRPFSQFFAMDKRSYERVKPSIKANPWKWSGGVFLVIAEKLFEQSCFGMGQSSRG